MRTLTILILLFSEGCADSDKCHNNNYQNITDYEITINSLTPNGINVDDSGFFVDLNELDRQVDEMEICVQNAFADGIDLETAQAQDCRMEGWNYRTDFFGISVKRECLIVKIALDWYTSRCSGQQVFPCDINPQVCIDKGLEITNECPCQCRSMIQDENIIITTPDLYLFRGELARMMTGCNNPWFGAVSACLVDQRREEENEKRAFGALGDLCCRML